MRTIDLARAQTVLDAVELGRAERGPCLVSGCPRFSSGWLCQTVHGIEWVRSKEYDRAHEIAVATQDKHRVAAAFVDFVRRIEAEERNGGAL